MRRHDPRDPRFTPWLVALAGAAIIGATCGTPDLPPVPAAPPELPTAMNWRPDETGFMARGFVTRTGYPLPYRLCVPTGYRHDGHYPVVIWLHGAGGTGSDNLRQISGDQIPGTRLWLEPEQQRAHPAIVLVPQSDTAWRPGADTRPGLQPEAAAVLELVGAIEAEFSVDARRIYLLGQSAGGHAVWNLLTHAADRFAASILVCPVSTDVAPVDHAAGVPLWVFQGSDDSLANDTRARVNDLERAGGHPRFTEYKGAGHDIWRRVFQEPGLADWLFAQARR